MKEEIIAKILAAPLSEWLGGTLDINGVKANLQTAHGCGQAPWIIRIEGVDFSSPEIDKLHGMLKEYKNKQIEKDNKEKLTELYNKICIDRKA